MELFDQRYITGLSPIIKWAGGKEKEIKYIIPNAPVDFDNYYEPFVGGGSVYTSFKAKKYFINDKSYELISLYRNIALQDKKFYEYVYAIMTVWNEMLEYVQEHQYLVSLYKQYRTDLLDDNQLKIKIKEYLNEYIKEIIDIVSQYFTWDLDVFEKEINTTIVRKLLRMRKIEKERNLMPEKDIYDNVETAFMGSLYMYFRSLYNNKTLCEKDKPLAISLFLFIRNYAYSGMFRYNSSGDFNVPYGGIGYNHKKLDKKVEYYQSADLLKHLKDTYISNADFEDFFDKYEPTENDFVFLDPPYDSEFSTYAGNEFTQSDQKRLADYLIKRCRAKWMMVIKYTPFIYSLYNQKGLSIKTFDKTYLVSFMNRNNKQAEHLIITNY